MPTVLKAAGDNLEQGRPLRVTVFCQAKRRCQVDIVPHSHPAHKEEGKELQEPDLTEQEPSSPKYTLLPFMSLRSAA